MIRRTFLCYLLAALAGLLLWREEVAGLFEQADKNWSLWLAANSGTTYEKPSTVFLRFDPKADTGLIEWPPASSDYAVVADHLVHHQPAGVVFHPVIAAAEDDHYGASLATSLGKLPAVVLGSILENNPLEADFFDKRLATLLGPLSRVVGDPSGLPVCTGIHSYPSSQIRAAGQVAFTRIDPDLGWQVVRRDQQPAELRIPLLARLGDAVIPSLALRSVMIWRGIPESELEVRIGDRISLGDQLSIPIDQAGTMLADLELLSSLPDVLAGNLDPATAQFLVGDDTGADLEALAGSLVVAGIDDESSRIVDLGTEKISPVKALALGIATIQTNRHRVSVSGWLRWISWMAAGVAVLVIPWLGGKRLAVVVCAIVLLAIMTSILVFQTREAWVPSVAPALMVLFLLVVHLLMPEGQRRIRR